MKSLASTVRAMLVAATTEDDRGVEGCGKVKIDPSLPSRDCKECGERTFCHFRAVTLIDRSALLPRAEFIWRLWRWKQIVNFSTADLRPDELDDLAAFDEVMAEFKGEMEKDRAGKAGAAGS